MPKKKKASLGRSTKDAKRKKEVRANEDDNTYSQRLDTEKNRRSIEYLNETSDHYDDRMAKKRHKNNLMSKAINKEHKLASPAVTRGALKRKCFISTNELPEKNVSKEISKIIVYDFSKELASKYKSDSAEIANMSQSAKEIYLASLCISNKKKETKYCDIDNQEAIFQSIKVEHPTTQQSQMSETADPLFIDKIKEEICEENMATPIQDLSEVYIKHGEFGASEYQNEKENGMVDLEIKEELINPFVE